MPVLSATPYRLSSCAHRVISVATEVEECRCRWELSSSRTLGCPRWYSRAPSTHPSPGCDFHGAPCRLRPLVPKCPSSSPMRSGRAESGRSVSDGGWDRQRTATWDKANKAQAEGKCRRCKEADCPRAGMDSSEGCKREWEQRPVTKGQSID
jgi:hypothetical protein